MAKNRNEGTHVRWLMWGSGVGLTLLVGIVGSALSLPEGALASHQD